MGISLLVVPIVNKLLICRVQDHADKKVPAAITANALRSFTPHMDMDGKPTLLKKYVDPEENHEGGLQAYLAEIVETNSENWSLEWEMKAGPKKGTHVLEYKDVKTDQEIAKSFLKNLKDTLSDTNIKVRNSKLDMARTILVGGEIEQVKLAVQSLDETAVIVLENIEHDEWISNLIASHAWSLLKATKRNQIKSDISLRSSNKARDEYKKKLDQAQTVIEEQAQELTDLEVLIWGEGTKIFDKVLENEGYLVPTRRECGICEDKRNHNESNIPPESINQAGYVEERCPLFSVSQQCGQCGGRPPLCYSNTKVEVCRLVEESECLKPHYGKIPRHTIGLHSLEHTEDLELIKTIVNRYGGCNFPEYQKFSNEVIDVDEDML